jgi:hypothetical protein
MHGFCSHIWHSPTRDAGTAPPVDAIRAVEGVGGRGGVVLVSPAAAAVVAAAAVPIPASPLLPLLLAIATTLILYHLLMRSRRNGFVQADTYAEQDTCPRSSMNAGHVVPRMQSLLILFRPVSFKLLHVVQGTTGAA